MKIRVEKMKKGETHLVLSFLENLYIELGEEAGSIKFLNEDFVEEIILNGRTEIYLIRTDANQLLGIFTLTTTQAIYAGGEYGVVDEMYIAPEFRSMKAGTEIIKELKKIGIGRKWNRIDVTAPTDQRFERTVNFYKENGFVYTGPKLKLLI